VVGCFPHRWNHAVLTQAQFDIESMLAVENNERLVHRRNDVVYCNPRRVTIALALGFFGSFLKTLRIEFVG
jgi:hypothetical protein